jgi:hypothetical protein
MKATMASILACLLLVSAVAQQRKGTGVIHGTVVAQNGQPAKRLTLFAEPLDVGGQFPSTKSNSRGEYRFEKLPWGRYRVVAEDDSAGYSAEAVDDRTQPSVEISRDHPEAAFLVVLPSKAGLPPNTPDKPEDWRSDTLDVGESGTH